MNKTMKAAVNCAVMGWSVIPLKPGSKEPLIPWMEFKTRLPTMSELRKWFQNTQNNLGIVTGKLSNLSVLDVDDPRQCPNITSSITVLTRRGKHLYFAYTGETNSASKIAEHVDVRGEGGFVVAPPSIVDGVAYRFISPVVHTIRLRPFPRQLLNVSVEANNGGNNVKPHNPPGWIAKTLDEVAEGGPRTPNFVKVIGRLNRDGHVPDDIFALLEPVATARSYDLNKLKEIILDVTTRYGQGKSETVYAEGSEAEDIETFLEGDEEVEWIVPGVIAKNTIGFVAGLPETFKTWILADLAIEAAVGGKWLGTSVAETKVLFIDQERFRGETRRRFKKMLTAKNIGGSEVKGKLYIQVGSTIKLNNDVSFEAFRKKLGEIKPELVIIDSFATFHTAAENDRQDIQKVLERVKQLRQEFGCTFLFIDHEGKSVLNPLTAGEVPDAFKMVGSVGKPAAAETVLTVRKESANSVTLYHTKSSLAPATAPKFIEIIDVGDGVKVVCKE